MPIEQVVVTQADPPERSRVTSVEVSIERSFPVTEYGTFKMGRRAWIQIGAKADYLEDAARVEASFEAQIKECFDALPEDLKAYYRGAVRAGIEKLPRDIAAALAERKAQLEAIKKGSEGK
jgi:hypothetical protein